MGAPLNYDHLLSRLDAAQQSVDAARRAVVEVHAAVLSDEAASQAAMLEGLEDGRRGLEACRTALGDASHLLRFLKGNP